MESIGKSNFLPWLAGHPLTEEQHRPKAGKTKKKIHEEGRFFFWFTQVKSHFCHA